MSVSPSSARLRERLIFAEGEYPAGTPCEFAPPDAAALILHGRLISAAGVAAGDLLVIRLGGKLRIVSAGAVQLVAATSSEAA